MRSGYVLVFVVACGVTLFSGCSDDAAGGDTGQDVSGDAGLDAEEDTDTDIGTDIGTDVADDAAGDVTISDAPVADAGVDQHVKLGATVQLDGLQSHIGGERPESWSWTIVTAPVGSVATLSDSTAPNPTFVPDVVGVYEVELMVGAGGQPSLPDRVVVTVTDDQSNATATAHAGPDQQVKVGDTVQLSGAASQDSDGNPLTYSWSLLAAPGGSAVAGLTPADAVGGSFIADRAGDFEFQLVVHDGAVDSAPDSVTITANPAAPVESLYSKLLALGLDSTDAHYLEANHPADAAAVVAQADNIWSTVVLNDAVFASANDPDGAPFADPLMTDWTPPTKARFAKMWGRIVFLVNSPKFQQDFDAQVGLLNAAYQGNPPALPFPSGYAGFRTAVNGAVTGGASPYKFFLSNAQSGVAWGLQGLRLKVERVGMMGDTDADTPSWDTNGAAGLVFHELTHTVGYAHDGTPASLVNLKPNNIPYFVQIIAAYQASKILEQYCGGSPACETPNVIAGYPDALLTYYFTNN